MVVRDPQGQMGPYAYTRLNLSWVGYDDAAFATVKANYITSKGLGKAMVWDISLDDFANLCGDGANPIQTAIAQTIDSNFCRSNGLLANPMSCTSFYSCAFGFYYLMNCPSGLYFNPAVSYCDWPQNVNCNINKSG